MIRVVHAITRLTLGGAADNTLRQIAAMARAGYDTTLAVGIAASEENFVERARRQDCRLVDVPTLDRDPAPLRDVRAVVTLVRLLRRQRPAIVHTHTSKAGFVGRLAARLARTPAIIHQPHGHIFYGYHGRAVTAFYVALERVAARWSDRVVTLTDREIEEHLDLGIGHRAQFVTVPSGVPTAELRARAPRRETARDALGLPADAFVVAALGRLVPVKGFDLLVEAMPALLAAVPAAHAVIIGDGPEEAALAARAERLGVLSRVRLHGPSSDVAALLAAADVLAAPSRNEGMGRALVEAMALGVPVVGSDVGGIPSVVGDDEAGRVIPPDDVPALAAALIELGRDGSVRAKLAEVARERAETFSTAVAETRMLDLYAALVREKRLT
ncbi:MAG TPA: glycosyltransferase [Candidatus Acidoferrum sp.]|nr:glycosyltransferase [Candidatus Acidoferrum sp.]